MIIKSIPYSGLLWGGGGGGGVAVFSAIFFPVNNFPRHNKNPPTQLFGFLGGMGHDTFNMFNKHIYLII